MKNGIKLWDRVCHQFWKLRFFGLKLSRFREWLFVVAEEGRTASWLGRFKMAVEMVRHGLAGVVAPAKRKGWRRKMRCCGRCPIYDAALKRCRPFTGSSSGCGCYVIYLALSKDQCFADENVPGHRIGWQTSRK